MAATGLSGITHNCVFAIFTAGRLWRPKKLLLLAHSCSKASSHPQAEPERQTLAAEWQHGGPARLHHDGDGGTKCCVLEQLAAGGGLFCSSENCTRKKRKKSVKPSPAWGRKNSPREGRKDAVDQWGCSVTERWIVMRPCRNKSGLCMCAFGSLSRWLCRYFIPHIIDLISPFKLINNIRSFSIPSGRKHLSEPTKSLLNIDVFYKSLLLAAVSL